MMLSVEAIGSGVELLCNLKFPWTATVDEIKQCIEENRLNTPTGGQRLFLGHGGKELSNGDATLASLVSASGLLFVYMVVRHSLRGVLLLRVVAKS